jgi:hypothetical protein
VPLDLHLHSWLSDGLPSPTQVVDHAAEVGLNLIALTDHDTAAGHSEAAAAASRESIRLIAGIEMTTVRPNREDDEWHMLGYFVQPDHPTLLAQCADTQRALRERLARIISRLNARGRAVDFSEVDESAPNTEVLDRPHLARIMLQRGWVESFPEAFQRHLGHEGDCFSPLDGPTPEDAIACIHAAGGIAVLAHPKYVDYPRGATETDIRALAEAGLDGLEVHHLGHTPEEVKRYAAIASKLGLIVTGGSDCHGARQEDGRRPIETCCVPDWIEDQLLERCPEQTAAL